MPRRERCAVQIGLIGALLALAGCGASPTDEPFQKTRPRTADVLGTWTMEPSCRAYLTKKGYGLEPTRLVLRRDAAYSLVGMPNWSSEYGTCKRTYRASRGDWRLTHDISGWYVYLIPEAGEGSNWQGHQCLYVRREGPPYLLYATTMDPDVDKAVFFERESQEAEERPPLPAATRPTRTRARTTRGTGS